MPLSASRHSRPTSQCAATNHSQKKFRKGNSNRAIHPEHTMLNTESSLGVWTAKRRDRTTNRWSSPKFASVYFGHGVVSVHAAAAARVRAALSTAGAPLSRRYHTYIRLSSLLRFSLLLLHFPVCLHVSCAFACVVLAQLANLFFHINYRVMCIC